MIRPALSVLALPLLICTAALAEPSRYALDRDRSRFAFDAAFGADRLTGTIPVASADVLLDLVQPPDSRISVTLNSRQAKANFPLATRALRGPGILNAGASPAITFQSREMAFNGSVGRVSGEITLRGQTRPIAFDARLYRQRGQEPDDLSRLSVRLTGHLNRSDFGADGWSGLVGDQVNLTILVRLTRAE
ncbi:YceI family protein [Rhodovulum sp. P5]|uniref:YceI family protein n=1 Tax=Rhodovulum sp. P5 TaxID=1564506 RepID=UPI0012ECA8CA|nr:YceI family protein [Rhodovulum sp. P5]